jgi:hypothetical protein
MAARSCLSQYNSLLSASLVLHSIEPNSYSLSLSLSALINVAVTDIGKPRLSGKIQYNIRIVIYAQPSDLPVLKRKIHLSVPMERGCGVKTLFLASCRLYTVHVENSRRHFGRSRISVKGSTGINFPLDSAEQFAPSYRG